MTRRRAIGLAVLLALGTPGCFGDDQADFRAPPTSQQERRIVQPAWDTLFRVGGTDADTLLQMPAWPVADSAGFAIVDIYAHRVLRFDSTGALRWTYGREGFGPGEFAHPRDVSLAGDGATWVLDPRTARITVIDEDGRAARLLPLDGLEYPTDEFVPLSDGGAVVIVANGEEPLVRVGRDGAVERRSPLPWSEHAELPSLAVQLTTARHAGTGRWVAAYALGDGFYLFDGAGEAVTGRVPFVEGIPFATIETNTRSTGPGRTERTSQVVDPVFGALGVTLSSERIYILFGGRSQYRGRIIDSYSARDGSYVESIVLPRTVADITYFRGGFIVRYSDPWPTVAAWRPVDHALP